MKFSTIVVFIALIFTAAIQCLAQKASKESLRFQDKVRTYYLYVPETVVKEKPAPLIVMLHGSGRIGSSLVDKWKDLAKKEGIVIVGPDSSTSSGWLIPEDAPDFLYDMVEILKGKYPIDSRRIYIFGHSAGGVLALYVGLLESEYFAAVAVHAGAMRPDDGPLIERSKRKTPLSIFIGTNDRFFPLSDVRGTRDMLNARGFTVEFNEMNGHTHDYYGRSGEINQKAWSFLSKHRLESEPKYERYNWEKKS